MALHRYANEHLELQKKDFVPVGTELYRYLKRYGRLQPLPVTYTDLLNTTESFPLTDPNGVPTLWERNLYAPHVMDELNEGLTRIYALLKYNGDMSLIRHLSVDSIDYCVFGNSKPFRIKVMNNLNDNYDYYYLKIADASRVYGLELEHLLSPNKVTYMIDEQTLIEEHIVGIPGDQFVYNNLGRSGHNEVRLAKEFVKFNERCLVRLLGDMRAYNFVIDMTPDFDQVQYRIRAIDFDQQSYEGRRSFYMPQFFKENRPYVELAMKHLPEATVRQYQREERAMIARRVNNAYDQVRKLVDVMTGDHVSQPEKVAQLRDELADHDDDPSFRDCLGMGEILRESIRRVME